LRCTGHGTATKQRPEQKPQPDHRNKDSRMPSVTGASPSQPAGSRVGMITVAGR
jgi:hypothetical protein